MNQIATRMPIGKLKRQFRRLRNRNWEGREVPKEILLLLSPPRTGSTWFADAIRCHPDVDFWDTSVVFQELGLIGRRYPRDLSEQKGASKSLEIRPGSWENVPEFDLNDQFDVKVDSQKSGGIYSIEKIHPEFYDFNTDLFCKNLAKLRKSCARLKMLFLARDPTESIKSFLAYQERNPAWYPNIDQETLFAYMDRTYLNILELAQKEDGLIVDYSAVVADLPLELSRVYNFLWPDQKTHQQIISDNASRLAEVATNRQLRWKTGTAFLAKDVSTNLEEGDLFSSLDSQSGIHLKNCIRYYQKLLEH